MSQPAPPRTPADPAPDAEAPFLARWSARKQAAREAEAAPAAPSPPPAAPPPAAPRTEAKGDAPDASEPLPPGDEDMPPLESLGAGSDLSPFFSPRVSAGLRRAALRHLFRQPQFNVRDPLDDYAGDYRSYIPLGETITADMRHHMERLATRLRDAQDAEPAPEPRAATDTEGSPAPDTPPAHVPAADPPCDPPRPNPDDPEEHDADERRN